MKNCPYFNSCGACQYPLNDYPNSCLLKIKKLKELFPQSAFDFIPCANPYNYRRKVTFTFMMHKHLITAGLYKEGTKQVIPILDCAIQCEEANRIIKTVLKLANSFKLTVYNESGYGLLRHLQIRVSREGKALLTFVLAEKIFPSVNHFIQELTKAEKDICGIVFNYNKRQTAIVLGEEEKTVYGQSFLQDTLADHTFLIGSKSFYQVNPPQAEMIYEAALKAAAIRKEEIVLDAYTGTGTIAILAAASAKEVLAIDNNATAIKAARENKKINKVTNVRFICADLQDYLNNEHFDVIIVDPPRNGLNDSFLRTLLKINCRALVYISCNPETLKRDLLRLKQHYKLAKLQFFDQFAFTKHVEAVCLLTRKDR